MAIAAFGSRLDGMRGTQAKRFWWQRSERRRDVQQYGTDL